MALNFGILFGVLAMLSWGVSDFLAKKIIEKIGPYKTLLYALLFALIPFIFFFLFGLFPKVSPLSMNIVILFLLGGFVNFTGYLFFYKGLEVEKVSILSPIVACNPLVVIFLSMLFLKEFLSLNQGVGIALAILGLILTTLPAKLKKINHRGVILGLLTMISWGIMLFLLGYLVKATHWLLAALIFKSLTWVYSPLILKLKGVSFKIKETHLLYLLILVGILDVSGTLSYNLGASTELISVVGPIAALYPAVTLILARIFIKENLLLIQKLGIVSILIGLLLLSL